MIVNTIRITVHPEKLTELAQTIGRLLDPIKDVKGCQTFRFYLDWADDNSSLLVSEWDTRSDYLNYLRSNQFAILRGAIKVLSIRSDDSNALVPLSEIASERTRPQQTQQTHISAAQVGCLKEV